MDFLVEFGKLIISMAVLLFAANYLVKSSSNLAKALGVPGAIIGITLVAFGTSLPELTVSSFAAYQGVDAISISNIIGSNICNIAIVIGVAALFLHLSIRKKTVEKSGIYLMIGSTFFLVLLSLIGVINRLIGILMVIALLAYTIFIIRKAETERIKKEYRISKLKNLAIAIASLALVVVSGKFLIDSAVNVAILVGVSQWLIGATIIAIGTSFPEIAVSIIAAVRKEIGISIGNIVGSNLFNILWVLGFASLISPLTITFSEIWPDLLFLMVLTLFFSFGLLKRKITKGEGIIFVSIYVMYIYYLIAPHL